MAAGLAALDMVASDRRMESYQPYWAVRAHLLASAGDHDGAVRAFQLAMGLERDPAVRDYLSRCREELDNESVRRAESDAAGSRNSSKH